MSENNEIIRLLTDIRDAQRENLEEHRRWQYIVISIGVIAFVLSLFF